MKLHYTIAAACVALFVPPSSMAAVSAAEAAKLKSELTPFGAERAGNKDGTIPVWTGGMTGGIAGWSPGQRRTDPFKDEKPLYAVTAKNMDQYSAVLTEGQKAMLKRYPDSYRLDVYKTHRTAMAPQKVYDATAKNAVNGKLENGVPTNVKGGIPFPIPQTGEEIIQNHLLRWRGESVRGKLNGYHGTPEGKHIKTVSAIATLDHPYYSKTNWESGDYWMVRLVNSGPPIRAGEQLVDRQNVNGDKSQAWIYLTGQRRVRKLPNACCDTPAPATAGLMTIDEIGVWAGRHDRFEWKIIGKKEVLVPYNSNRTLVPKRDSDVLSAQHLNPDHVRWELHRVWELEANLRPGQRHSVAKSRYYVDEDTWMFLLGDRWDAKGQLWRTISGIPFLAPDLPGVQMGMYGYQDLLAGGFYYNEMYNEYDDGFTVIPNPGDATFTPESMSGEGVR